MTCGSARVEKEKRASEMTINVFGEVKEWRGKKDSEMREVMRVI